MKKPAAPAPPAKATKKPAAPAPPAKKQKAPKLTLPRSSAVILKLRPEAVVQGATYSSALLKAEERINLQELGIGPLRIRQSATGARLIEVPGATSGEKADALAAQLKMVLAEEAEVLRPEKKAEVPSAASDGGSRICRQQDPSSDRLAAKPVFSS